ncbi:MAG: YbhB/YbcL family Raf kinase inhibitor-like protein [Psittacicella sp.]
MTFQISSKSFIDGGLLNSNQISLEYNGKNSSPELSWINAPEGTKSFAISCYDPDAPTGSGFWHWYLVNIPKEVTSLVEDAGNISSNNIPEGSRQMLNDRFEKSYTGCMPPKGHGAHKYIFTVYALDVEHLEFPEILSTAYVGFNVKAHALAEASITGVYEMK